jgi:hypothetical protein
MTLELVAIRLSLNTSRGLAGYETRFGSGLNVLNADNSWGKSTLLQSIIYALGLEGALSASRKSPLGPAMTQSVDTPDGPASIIESAVTLWIKNSSGTHMRVQRWVVSGDVDPRIIRVWMADSEDGLLTAPRQDHYVRDPGAATSSLGFHRLLEDFLGWQLPPVPDFDGGETRLYLEVLLPLFYVEQKFGWSGITPRVPTHMRIRDPLRRAMEYVLGLHTLDRLRRVEALKEEESRIRDSWLASVARAREAAGAESFRLVMLDEKPVSTTQRHSSQLEVLDGEKWVPIETGLVRWRETLSGLGAFVTTAGDRTELTRRELIEAEDEAARAGAVILAAQESLALWQADHDALQDRLANVAADRSRLVDIRKIQSLGGELDLPLFADGLCPTCSQELDGRHVATGHVATLEDNIRLAESERTTLEHMVGAAEGRRSALVERIEAGQDNLQRVRMRVRALRDELVGTSSAPSIAEVQQRLLVEARIRDADRVVATVFEVEEELTDFAVQLDDVRARRAALALEPEVDSDRTTIKRFTDSFKAQLGEYGLRSVKPDEVTVDAESFLPISDGFELSFDLAMGISASDSIRTKWAYHTALAETSAVAPGGHPLGLLMLDEPRQQETNRGSLGHFLQRLNTDQELVQIIYATSEDADELGRLLEGVTYTPLPAVMPHLIAPTPKVG